MVGYREYVRRVKRAVDRRCGKGASDYLRGADYREEWERRIPAKDVAEEESHAMAAMSEEKR